MPQVKYAGVSIEAGDSVLIVPPLSLGQLRDVKQIAAVVDDPNADPGDRVQAKFDLVCVAIRRNYPDMTDEKLSELLDLVNIVPAFNAAIGVPGERTRGE